MLKIIASVLLLSFVSGKPRDVTSAELKGDDNVEPNSLDERLQKLQNSVAGVVQLLHDQCTKLADLKQKQDAMKTEILRRVDAKMAESTTKMINMKEYIHSMKKMMIKDVVKFPNPVYGDDNANYFIQGHVEVLHNDVWGTLCDDDLDANAVNGKNVATVLCRMQGYESGVYNRGAYKQSSAHKSSQIWITNVKCKGTENSIGECALAYGWGRPGRCNHNEDIGIRCFM